MKLDCLHCGQANGPFNIKGDFRWKCAYCSTFNNHVCNCYNARTFDKISDVEFEIDEEFDKRLNSEGE